MSNVYFLAWYQEQQFHFDNPESKSFSLVFIELLVSVGSNFYPIQIIFKWYLKYFCIFSPASFLDSKYIYARLWYWSQILKHNFFFFCWYLLWTESDYFFSFLYFNIILCFSHGYLYIENSFAWNEHAIYSI